MYRRRCATFVPELDRSFCVMLPPMIRAVLALLLAASPLGAGMVDREPAAEPASTLINAHSPRVVASEIGMFLAGGQRVTVDGALIDEEPVPFAEGHAAGWEDGWLLVGRYWDDLVVRHLRATGSAEVVTVIPRAGERLQGIASASGSLAILEINGDSGDELILTLTNTREIVRRQVIGRRAFDAAIVRLGDGFIVAWWSDDEPNAAMLSVARFDLGGLRVSSRVLERPLNRPHGPLRLAASDTHALVLWSMSTRARYRVVDIALQPRVVTEIGGPGTTFRSALSTGDSEEFFLSYTRAGQDRLHIVRPDGQILGDTPADPVSGGDHIGRRYLVTRPWGHAAIADGDPRTIAGPAIQLRRRVFERWDHLLSVVSGDVTLLRFGRALEIDWFVRVDADGKPIDSSPRGIPSPSSPDLVTVAIPGGFAFAWLDGDAIRYQRLSQRGEWIDADPITLPVSTGRRLFALHANDQNVLIAWTSPGEVLWMRLTHAGEPIDIVPRRMGFATSRTYYPSISIASNGSDRLLAMLGHHICVITCEPAEPLPFIVGVLTLDSDANPIGIPTPTDTEGLRVVGLPDGTWVMPSQTKVDHEPEVVHLARDGSIIARAAVPVLASYDLWDIAPTSTGWKALVPGPVRLVEFEGAATPSRVTAFTTAMRMRFAAAGRVAFFDGSIVHESAVPWTGRITSTPGDFSVMTTDFGVSGNRRRFLVTVRNTGQGDVTNIVVHRATFDGGAVTIPMLRPGEAHQFIGEGSAGYVSSVLALSPDVTDTNPSDNWSSIATSEPPGERQHPVRR